MIIGYARISTTDQNLTLQQEQLRCAGCERIFTDEGASGGAQRRPRLDEALALIKPGDVFIVWSLGRLGRSLSHIVDLLNSFGERGIGFRSLSESIDTTDTKGVSAKHIFSALAKFERSLIVERTSTGLTAAKLRGAKLGRKPKLTSEKIDIAKRLIDAGDSPTHVAKTLGVSTATLYRAIPAGASNRNMNDLFSVIT